MGGVRRFLAGMVSLLLFVSLAGCQGIFSKAAKDEYPVTVGGREFAASPERVVVASDSIADIILAIRYEIKLKGRTSNCTQSELSVLPEVGSAEHLDIEAIKSLSADLLLVDEDIPEEQRTQLEDAGVVVLKLELAKSREQVENLYHDIGALLGGAQTGATMGDKAASSILLTLDDINRVIPKSNVVTTACYLYDENGNLAKAGTFTGELIEFAGAVNIASDASDTTFDINSIKLSEPKYIFCDVGVKDKLYTSSVLSSLDAVKGGRVFEIPAEMMTRQGRTMVEAVSQMAGIMYPKITNDGVDPSSYNISSSEPVLKSYIEITEGLSIPYGEVSDNVMILENRLDALNYMPTAPSGEFDESTKRAVTDFQYLNHIATTGEADERTLRLIFSENAIARPDPAREK